MENTATSLQYHIERCNLNKREREAEEARPCLLRLSRSPPQDNANGIQKDPHLHWFKSYPIYLAESSGIEIERALSKNAKWKTSNRLVVHNSHKQRPNN